MEDYEAQEVEFWAKLEEEGMSRSSMLRRSAAAAVGLTVMGSASTALGMSRARLASPPTKGSAGGMVDLIKRAKKEGHLNVIALPPDWANYGEMISTFTKKYGIGITSDNPNGSSAEENQAIVSLKGDARAPDAVDVGVAFAITGANTGLYAKYFPSTYSTIPRSMKDGRGFWMGDYWGAISIGYNQSLISNPPKTWKDLLKPEYKGKVALNGSPLSSNSAVSGVLAASLANGGSLHDVGRASRADIRVGENVLFPLCAPCKVAQSGRTKLTKRGMRLLESGQASVVVVGARGELRGRVVTRH